MKIVRLTAENFKRLVAVEITPKGNTVLITGRNGAGKSSILDAIVSALCGKKYQPDKPIRAGEDHAEVKVETENWIIKRTFTAAGGGQVTVTNKDGMRGTSPQGLLDKIVGEIAFDPMLFIRMGETAAGERDQLATVMRLAKLDFSDIDAKIATAKTDRADVRRDKERYEFEAGRIDVAEDTPDEEVSVVELAEQLQEATAHNAEIINLRQEVKDIELGRVADATAIEEQDRIISDSELRVAELQAVITEASQKKEKFTQRRQQKKVQMDEVSDSIQPEVDPTEINTQIAQSQQTNADVRLKKQKAELLTKAEAEAEKWRSLGADMKAFDKEKATRLSEATMPLEGLSVTEDGVVWFDKHVKAWIPLSQVNDAGKLEIGMGIAMAQNPELRVILMKGNDLDEDSLKVVSQMAKDRDFMVWIERIEGAGGIVIEDGSVKAAPVQKLDEE